MNEISKKFGFPISVEVPSCGSQNDFYKDVFCRTENMLREQMSTFGITIDRILRVSNCENPEIISWIDTKENVLILTRHLDVENESCKITYMYEDSNQN